MQLSEFQRLVERIYYQRDNARGAAGTFVWFVEEVGELASELRRSGPKARMAEEFADVLAWLCTLASISGVELEEAVKKYADGCPRCGNAPCTCSAKD